MKRETLFLKLALTIIGLIVIVLGIVVVPFLVDGTTHIMHGFSFVMGGGLLVTCGCVLNAVVQAYTLLQRVDQNTAFSLKSITALKRIKWSAYIVAVMFLGMLPLAYWWTNAADAPGILLLSCLILAAATVIGIFASILQKLVANAFAFKTENELTI
ncbi:DUF2975 domain-containing protein [Levilactobacillus fujinensis]|uniref:DUF2975 domain-containing protein n=1 Tax=Levilactobacillus fujinensis TaxID=2486024 RepID=A0ABW1TK77_9LACO|nr:DUF2975 domain-containing protein [Levilactobacillus fujinensis]